jgi:enoyl-CoA hydratase/carnithine racemase
MTAMPDQPVDRAAPQLIVSLTDGVATILINRPTKRNAMTLGMWTRMANAVESLSQNEVARCLVISGQGGDFCAGADIGEFDAVRGNAVAARAYEAENSRCFRTIREAPFPTIAAVEGICFGGGFGIAAACDLRIGTADSRYCIPAAKLGLAYPQDAMIDIVSALGPQLARYLAFSAAQIDGTEAHAKGFLLELCLPDDLHERAAGLAQTIAKSAPLSVRASKAAIAAVISGEAADAERAKTLGNATFDSADYAEGRRAFKERRMPIFRGA